MESLSIRFMIGLHSPRDGTGPPSGVVEGRAECAIRILSREYSALTATRAQGYWKGQPEPSLVVEVVVEDPDMDLAARGWEVARVAEIPEGRAVGRAQALAGEVARALGQDCVALAVAPVRFSLEGPHATEG